MARLTQHGLRRVLGTSALFSTAYGNVGSSIYYALGLVASYALGLTPIVFLITGVIFYLTAATYAEATAMFKNDPGSARKVMRERLKIDDPLVIEETQKSYPRYMPNVPYPTRPGIAVIKAFLERTEPALRQLSIDDQIDIQLVREARTGRFL